jgi:hypothetical protein
MMKVLLDVHMSAACLLSSLDQVMKLLLLTNLSHCVFSLEANFY